MGNLNTLKTQPQNKGVDVRKALFKFFNTYYSSNNMTATVYGNLNMRKLETIVNKALMKIPLRVKQEKEVKKKGKKKDEDY